MAADDVYERALNALLAGEAVSPGGDLEAPPGQPLDALRVLSAIGQVSRAALFGSSVQAQASVTWGHLEVRDEIGRGASGTVYRAWDTRLAREVALKLFDPDSASADAALTEGRLLARLRHPNVVTVYGVDNSNGVAGLWMELVEGDTLDELVQRDGPFSVEDALLVGIDLANALAAVHAAGMLHRDVKAHNVVRQRGGRLVLMDFGAGRDAEGISSASDGAGTPLYMAPEQLQGAPPSVQNDIYGLGVLLHYLVTGGYPVEAPNLAALRRAHSTGERRPLASVNRHVPPAACAVIERACAPDRAARYATMQELDGVLGDVLREVLDCQARVVPHAVRRWRRWRRTALTAATVVFALVVAAIPTWNTTPGRAARRALELPVPPRSPLYFTYGGSVGVIDGTTLRVFAGGSQSSFALAVSEQNGIRPMPSAPPWTPGAWLRLDGTPVPPVVDSEPGVCCYYDGTTDGHFNYALRQDSTLLEPIGSRPLAAPAIHRFDLEWRHRETLFEIGPPTPGTTSRGCTGIAYDRTSDAFWVTCNEPDGTGQAVQWSRDGQKTASFAVAARSVAVASDPADGTLWLLHHEPNDNLLHFDNVDRRGRRIGTFTIPEPFAGIGAMGVEFAWPATR